MAAKKKKATPAKASSLGTGGARKAANAILKRKSDIDKAAKGGASKPAKAPASKSGPAIDMSNPGAYRKYQLEQAKKQTKKKKK